MSQKVSKKPLDKPLKIWYNIEEEKKGRYENGKKKCTLL